MRISDWSSDVCSSDLCLGHPMRAGGAEQGIELRAPIIALGGPRIASCPRAHERDVSKRLQRPFGIELGPMVENCSEQGDILLAARLGAQDFLEMILHLIVECQDLDRKNVARQPLHLLRHFIRVDNFAMPERCETAAGGTPAT